MSDQNSPQLPQNPLSPTTPEQLLPTEPAQGNAPVQSSSPKTSPQSETLPHTEPFYKNKIFIIICVALLVLILVYYGVVAFLTSKGLVISKSQYEAAIHYTPEPVSPFPTTPPYVPYTPPPEKVCNSPLAPAGAGPVSKCNYRDSKISVANAQAVYSRIYKVFGVTQIPSNLAFHEEVYKGIHIKWTDNQPISPTTMAWLKNAIDILPPYFYQDHPVMAIYSATPQDLQTPGVAPEYLGAIAYASGLNIFIVKDLADGKSNQYVVNQYIATQALFHEWTHVTQFYDTLQTFTEDYLSIPGNASVVMGIDPVTKDYAKTAGWVFQDDQYGDSEYAILGTDAASQKQTDYGKTKYIEDMAEAGSYFMLCKDTIISEARIKWWEQKTGTSRNSYCPSKVQ